MKKLFFLFCAALLVLLAAPACRKNSVPSKKIGVSIPAADHGWAAGVVWNSEQAKAEIEAKYPGSRVIVLTAKNTKEQTDSIETLLMQQVDALVVMSQDPLPLTNVCKKALKQGVFLAIVSNPVPDVTPDLFVNGDNRSFGIAGAKAIGESLSGKGKIVIMKGQPCPIDNDRVGGFKETLQAQFPEITLIDEGDAFWNAQKGQQLMETFLQKHQQIDGVWAGDDDVLEGVLKAYEKSGRTDVQVIGGRYGLGSKDTPPASVFAVYDELKRDNMKRQFTIGIVDDVTNLSLP